MVTLTFTPHPTNPDLARMETFIPFEDAGTALRPGLPVEAPGSQVRVGPGENSYEAGAYFRARTEAAAAGHPDVGVPGHGYVYVAHTGVTMEHARLAIDANMPKATLMDAVVFPILKEGRSDQGTFHRRFRLEAAELEEMRGRTSSNDALALEVAQRYLRQFAAGASNFHQNPKAADGTEDSLVSGTFDVVLENSTPTRDDILGYVVYVEYEKDPYWEEIRAEDAALSAQS